MKVRVFANSLRLTVKGFYKLTFNAYLVFFLVLFIVRYQRSLVFIYKHTSVLRPYV